MDVPLVAIDAPPSVIGGLVRAHWDAGEAVLPLPWSGACSVAERRAARQLVDRLAPQAIVRVAAAGAPPVEARHATTEPTLLPAGTALVVTTSGSTGEPKGVVLSHDALRASTAASLDRLGAGFGERFALALPTHHVAGLQVLLRAWACGTEPLVVSAADTVLPAGGGVVSLVPTQLHRMVVSRPDTLRDWTVLVGGGAVDPGSVGRARAAGATVVSSYGMSETCGGCVYDGVPLDGVDADVRADGRIRVRGRVLFDGYLRGGSGTPVLDRGVLDDGWFVTGDAGRIRDGRLEVIGRSDDVIVTGGENVPADAVTAALRAHPRIVDAAVVGAPDEEWGRAVVAVVVPEGEPPSLDELRRHVAASHPRVYAPRYLVVVDRLPTDRMGKPDRAALEALAATPTRTGGT